jgi:hypothetical protein
MPANIQDWDDFTTVLVTHLKTNFPGVVDYELWNEPDQGFTGTDGNENSTSTAGNLASLAAHAYNIIRQLDPGATIVAPSYTSATNLDKYYAYGGPRNVDVNSIHAYPNPSNDIAETIQGFLTTPYRTVFAKYGIQDKPMWDTEGSWGWEARGATTSTSAQVAFVARDYLLHWSLGFSRFYWYVWEDMPGGWGFLLDNSTHTLRPAATAYQQVYDWMVGATMPSPCTYSGTDAYHAIYECTLTRPSGYRALAAWNTTGSFTLSVSDQYKHFKDLSGGTASITGGTVTIGIEPILLTP